MTADTARGPRPTWDQASDDEILEEIAAIREAGLHINFGAAVEALLRQRGLWDKVSEPD